MMSPFRHLPYLIRVSEAQKRSKLLGVSGYVIPSFPIGREPEVTDWIFRRLQSGYGTRLIPEGAISGAHFIQTPNYFQIADTGDLTKINIAQGDGGGELDPHVSTASRIPKYGIIIFSHKVRTFSIRALMVMPILSVRLSFVLRRKDISND